MTNSAIAVEPKISRGFEGLIHGATLGDLVQMECLGMTTRAVRIDRGEQSGHIYFCRGQVVHAELGGLRGEAALTALIGWPDGSFSIEEGLRPYEETITRHWQSLLIEAAQLHDELQGEASNIQPMVIPPAFPDRKGAAFRKVLEDAEVQSAAYFSYDGVLIDGKGDNAEEVHATFSYVAEMARLIGSALGAEGLQEIHLSSAGSRSLCVLNDEEAVAIMTTAKANLPAFATKLTEVTR